MDRYCEFCVNLRSVVYCKADAAYLCLSCDTKVHSANPLSNRHYRNLVCESCRRRPTYVHCYDHQKFMCRGCDLSQHNASSKHRKKVVKSYVGCPSARDLGVLWGFNLNPFFDGSRILEHKFCVETNEQIKGSDGGIQAYSVLEQLVDLLKVQTSDVDHISSVMNCQQHEIENDVDQFSQQPLFEGGHLDNHDIILDSSSFPFTHLDHLESSDPNETTLQDSFWQWKSSASSSQLWCHNMQDLGVCEEEPSCLDDLDIPDIDHTFRNFEELFRNEEEPTRVDQDTSMACVTLTESSPKKARYTSQITSFSFSRISDERSDTTCIDSGVSPLCGSPKHYKSGKSEGKKIIDQIKDSEQGHCGHIKGRSDTRKRTKSQSWKFKSHESATRSC